MNANGREWKRALWLRPLACWLLAVLLSAGSFRILWAGEVSGLAVVALHPVVADLARLAGGERVSVSCLVQPGEDPHLFRPTPADIKLMQDADLVLASGKGLEPFLDGLRASIETPVFDCGAVVPSIHLDEGADFCENHEVAGHEHPSGSEDPHWWHSVENARRVVRDLKRLFVEMDPVGAGAYEASYATAAQTLDDLELWVKETLSSIPDGSRVLVTAHSAFNYLCRAYDLEARPVLGLTAESEPDPVQLSGIVKMLRAGAVRVVFPEQNTNPRVLDAMMRDAGVRFGEPLLADSVPVEDATYAGMVKWNVQRISAALGGVSGDRP